MTDLQPGDVLRLAAGEWKYGDGPLVLRVERVRGDLSRYYDGEWMWVEGHRLDEDGSRTEWTQALIRPTTPAAGDSAGAATGRRDSGVRDNGVATSSATGRT